MQERDDQILKHIGLYNVSIRGVIETLFFDGESCDHVLQRLQENGCIKAVKGLPDNLSYYQLTLSEARTRGVPKHRADARGDRLPEDLAVLWFACMGEKPRPRLERKSIAKVFGDGPGMGKPHCRERLSNSDQVIHRVRLAGPGTDDGRLLRDLEWWSRSALSHPQLAPFLLAHMYRFTVLAEDADRVTELQRLVKKRETLAAIVTVEEVPGPHRLAAILRKRKFTHAGGAA